MNSVCAGLCDHVENAARGASELDAVVSGLRRHLFHGVGNVERLSYTCEGDIVVFGTVQQKVVAAQPLAVHRKLNSLPSA